MKKYFSNNTGNLYFVTPQIGSEGHSYNLWNGYIVRWDYYTELGYPEVKSDDDMLKVLSDIQKKHPTTPDGKKTYGYGFWTDQKMWPWHIRAKANFGYADWGPEEYVIKISDNSIVNNYVDLTSPFWADMKYYNKAYNLGLIDPDSFTQLNADYGAKGKSGVYLSGPVTWGMDTNYWEEAKKDANTLALPISIPVEGVYSYTDSITDIGWTNKMLCITKNCKIPERAMDFINSMNDPDIIRLLYSGIKGKDWDVIDGKPQLKPETVAASADPNGTDAWEKRGIGYFNQNVIGLSGWFKNPKDNAPLNLFNDKSVWLGKLKPAEKNFSAHYGVEYPFQAHENLVKQGKAFTQENLQKDIPNALVTAPDDIKRIQVKVEEIALKAVPKLVMAKNNDEFVKEQNKLISDLKAAGQDTSWAWWQKAWADAKAIITGK